MKKLNTLLTVMGLIAGLLLLPRCGSGLCPFGGCEEEPVLVDPVPFFQVVNVDGAVRAILENPTTNDVYIGGDFVNVDGVSANFFARLNSDGSRDSDFSVGAGFNATVHTIALAMDSSGDVYVGGDFSLYDGNTANSIVRLNSDGSMDTGFNRTAGPFNNSVYSIVMPQDGTFDVYAAGRFNLPTSRIVRFNSDGAVDTHFNTGTGLSNTGISLAWQTNGDIYVGGEFTTFGGIESNRIVRINSNGTRDNGFDISTGGFDNSVASITLASDGSANLYVGGTFSMYNGAPANRLVRILPGGTMDGGFDTGTGPNGDVDAVAIAPGLNDLLASGNFFSFDGQAHGRLIRLNSDGSYDSTFNLGAGFDSRVLSVHASVSAERKVFAGGAFSTLGSTGAPFLNRLTSDGLID